ncbi:hypothetical protein AQUCO_01400880v1 [Aquilegia coerulea]|uniref:Uncharacterized protein n=1 Tax=Aquilegia coerulea TaxID=218851 RepID=A0A2G5DYK6_AQUCA|nr:hypothetical protein AQUCO_01400880v1 [Aquilegia coerulea]
MVSAEYTNAIEITNFSDATIGVNQVPCCADYHQQDCYPGRGSGERACNSICRQGCKGGYCVQKGDDFFCHCRCK